MRIEKEDKRILQIASKHARNRKYKCLVPDCDAIAIDCHAIQLSSIKNALDENGVVYSSNPNYNESLNKRGLHYREIVKIPSSKASTFKGFCNKHDTLIFESIETDDDSKREFMYCALHVRATALEYCRKREAANLQAKLYELKVGDHFRVLALNSKYQAQYFKLHHLLNLLGHFIPSKKKKFHHYVVPMDRNIQVSCCGVFDVEPGNDKSLVGYNLIAEENYSFLALTTFGQAKYMDRFISSYSIDGNVDYTKLINDIVLLKGEEPLFAPSFWHSLDKETKENIGECLMHPNFRLTNEAPLIFKPEDTCISLDISATDFEGILLRIHKFHT